MSRMRTFCGIGFLLLSLWLPVCAQEPPVVRPRVNYEHWAGKAAPDFTLHTMDGERVSLCELKGKVVVLDFWASWCGPCVKELPSIEKLHREFQGKDVVILGVDGEDPADARAFVQAKNYTFPTLLDEGKSVMQLYQVRAIPTVLVIDRNGIVAEHFVGLRPESVLRAAIQKAQTSVLQTPSAPVANANPPGAASNEQAAPPVIAAPPAEPAPVQAQPTVRLLYSAHPSALKVILPTYPEAALARKISGKVEVRLLTNAQGKVNIAQALSGDPILRQAALTVINEWTFKPTLTMGQPIPTEYRMTFVFELPE